jgi:hypothetical protein
MGQYNPGKWLNPSDEATGEYGSQTECTKYDLEYMLLPTLDLSSVNSGD